MPSIRLCLSPTLLLLAACAVAEETTPPSSASVTAEPLIVEASRTDDPAFDQPRSTTVVGKRQLHEIQPRTAAEALRYQPGIWVQKTGHIGGAPIIRNAIGNRVVYLFDGVRRNTGSLFSGPNSFLNDVDPMAIRRVEVIRGPGSVLYGSDAIGGVVNVVTVREPVFADAAGGGLQGRTGSADHELTGRAEADGGFGDVYAAGGLGRSMVDDPQSGRGGKLMTPGGWNSTSQDAQADWRLGGWGVLEGFAQRYERDDARRYDRPTWIQSMDRRLYGARLKTVGDGVLQGSETTASWHDQRSLNDQPTSDSVSQDRTAAIDSQGTWGSDDGLAITGGVHLNRDWMESYDSQAGTRTPDATWDDAAAFALARWWATSRLRLELGLRVDRYTLQSTCPDLAELPGPIQTAIGNGALSQSDLELDQSTTAATGGVGATVVVVDGLNAFGNIGNAFRAPNKSDLLSYGPFTQGFSVPSPDVEPETSLSFELGTRWQADLVDGSLTGYITQLRNAVVQQQGTFNGSTFVDVDGDGVEDGGERVYVKTNSDDLITARGVEYEGTFWLPRAWSAALAVPGDLGLVTNGTWTQVSGRADDQLSQGSLLPVPANGLVGVRWENDRTMRTGHVWFQTELQGVRRFDDATAADIAGDNAFREDPQAGTGAGSPLLRADGSLPGYGTVNVRAGVDFTHASFAIVVENATNRLYRQAWSRLDATGANVVLSGSVGF